MTPTQINILLALSFDAFLHIAIEIWSVREKVRRLSAYMAKKTYKELPININTRLKSYSISVLGFALFTGAGYIFFSWIALSAQAAFWVIASLFLAMFLMVAVGLDKYHVEIEKVTKPFKNTK